MPSMIEQEGNPSGTFVPKLQTQGAGPANLTAFDVVAATNEAGAWSLNFSGSPFFGVPDSVMQLGYNPFNGDHYNPAIPSLFLQWEADYYQNGTARKMEFHLDFSPIVGGTTTIAAGSNGAPLPQATINVGSTAALPSFGNVSINVANGPTTVSYTGITGTTLTGCSGGSGTLSTGQTVTATVAGPRPIMIQFDRQTGLMSQFELRSSGITFTDWVTEATFCTLNVNGVAFTPPSGSAATITLGATGAGQGAALTLQYNTAQAFTIAPVSATTTQLQIGGALVATLFGGGSTKRMNVGPTGDNTHIFTAESDNGNTAINARGFSIQVGDILRVENSSLTQLWGITPAGLPRFAVAGNSQTTVGAAGTASALPANPTKYFKVVDSGGTTLVIPAYAAS